MISSPLAINLDPLTVRFRRSNQQEACAFQSRVSNVTRTTSPIVIELQYMENTMRFSHPS